MITSESTVAEMETEITQDTQDSQQFLCNRAFKEFRRSALKATKFPFQKMYSWKSRLGNQYYVVMFAHSKADIKHTQVTTDVLFWLMCPDGSVIDTTHHMCSQAYSVEEKTVQKTPFTIYTPHFFHRYHERCLSHTPYRKIKTEFIKRMGSQDAYSSICQSGIFSKSHGGDEEALQFWKDGIALGILREGKLYFRTFLSYNSKFTHKQQEYLQTMSARHLDLGEVYNKIKNLPQQTTYIYKE